MKCSVFIATTLDGYIARKNGGLDWLPGSDNATGSEDYGYNKFFESIDALILGRNTYELALSFKEWPYRGKRVFVLSSGFPKTGKPLSEGAEGTSSSPRELVRQLTAAGLNHAYVDGGKAIQSFLQAGLISEITITRVPILIGAGVPLFGNVEHDIRFHHILTHSFASGLVQSKYAVTDPT